MNNLKNTRNTHNVENVDLTVIKFLLNGRSRIEKVSKFTKSKYLINAFLPVTVNGLFL